MEFWGVEVKAGQPLKVKPTFDNIIHLSQASLGESKKEKGKDSVPVFVKFGDKKLVLGTLIPENIPQLSFDLVFEKEFELSHNWKNGSVYFCGYQTPLPQDDSEEFEMDDSEEDEELEVTPATNGKAGPTKVENVKVAAKPVAAQPVAAKPNASAMPISDIKPKEDSDDSDDSDDSMDDQFEDDSDEMSDEEGGADEDDSDDEEDEDDSEEETPKKVEVGKKRPSGSAQQTPVATKKAKAGTPQTGGKKGVHVATPHPSKQGGKTPANGDKTPKSGGISCKTCSKSFGTDGALQSHTKAKHSGGK
ncbi:hypothetical protein Ddye_025305 [Dipteronia dyeriana]|uniref:C2H2-type domain-containing protein n=1 Tax=Dipteronia dyeriana TaxID=168575 RepID=A0AAD9TWY7_9ROSI|nr:hypothetical protein Ddye_025305 [Dipteronia dyeriana]